MFPPVATHVIPATAFNQMRPLLLRLLFTSVIRASAYYFFVFVSFRLFVEVNEALSPDQPWFLGAFALLLYGATLWPARGWCKWPIVRANGTLNNIVQLTGLALCISTFSLVLSGYYFGLTATPLKIERVPSNSVVSIVADLAYPLIGAIIEEISFRGILQSRIAVEFGDTRSAIIVTAIFVLAHLGNNVFVHEIFFYAAVSAYGCVLAARTQSVLPAIILHMTTNGLILIAVTNRGGQVDFRRLPIAVIVGICILLPYLVWRFREVCGARQKQSGVTRLK